MNVYVITMEMIFFMLGIAAFMFTDATDDVGLKTTLGYMVFTLLWIFVIVNLYRTINYAGQGKEKLKEVANKFVTTRMNKR